MNTLLQEAHPKRLSFDDAVTRCNKVDKCVSVLWFLDKLKAFFVEVNILDLNLLTFQEILD